ncbi:MAG: hypothetical protein L3J29_12715 [Cyclobacteriaceae bacterium]|nr:hypothetical protein [Cyclobacteriaceae bacterium]
MSKSSTKVIKLTELNEQDISDGKKLFPADKNYILKEVQVRTENELLDWLVDYVKEYYETFHNPLGLVDTTIETIRSASFSNSQLFQEFYNDLAGIYRYKHGEIQLAFLFDGDSHYTKYKSEWKVTFMKWVTQLLHNRIVMRAFLEITVFGVSNEKQLELILNRLKLYVESHFQLKTYKYRGIQEVNVA